MTEIEDLISVVVISGVTGFFILISCVRSALETSSEIVKMSGESSPQILPMNWR